jgi:hypothetical protein
MEFYFGLKVDLPFNLIVVYNNWLQKVAWGQVFYIQCNFLKNILQNSF